MAKKRVQVEGVSAPTLKNSIGGLGQTFVSPEVNPRGAQIANALSSVIAPAVQQKVDEYQEDVRYVDGLKAKNQFALLEAPLNSWMQRQDYSIKEQPDGTIRRMTAEEHFATWPQADQYQAALDSLGSKTAKRAFEHSIGQSLATSYSAATVAYDKEEMKQTIAQTLEVDLSQGVLSQDEAIAAFDARMVQHFGGNRQPVMEELLVQAEKHFRGTGSTAIYDYIEKRGMGNDAWKLKAASQKESVLNEVALANNRQYNADKRKRDEERRQIIVTAGQRLLVNPNDDLNDLVEKGLAAGIDGIKGDLNTVIKNHAPPAAQPFKMTNTDKGQILDELSSKGTKEAQMDFLMANAEKIDPETFNTWLGWVNSGSIYSLEKDPDYSAAVDFVKGELAKEGASESWKDVQLHLKDIYLQLIERDEYKNASPTERLNMSDKVLEHAMKRAGVTDNKPNQPLSAEIERTEAAEAVAAEEQQVIDDAITAMEQVEEAKKAQAKSASLSNVQAFASGSSDTVPTLGDLRNLISDKGVKLSDNTVSLINDAIKSAGGDVDEATLTDIVNRIAGDESSKESIKDSRDKRKEELVRFYGNKSGQSKIKDPEAAATKRIAEEEEEALEEAEEAVSKAEKKLQMERGEINRTFRGKIRPKSIGSAESIAKAEENLEKAQEELAYAEKVISIK